MQIQEFGEKGPLLITHQVFGDDRGFFFESFNAKRFQSETGIDVRFVQDNESHSKLGTVRGLHFQMPPFAQAKLVTVVVGQVLDVVVDIRKGSPTYGQHVVVRLNDKVKQSFYIPEGFAHGFACESESCIFQYKCSNYYNKDSEGAVLWNDTDLAIQWGIDSPVVSDKDKLAEPFAKLNSPFNYAG